MTASGILRIGPLRSSLHVAISSWWTDILLLFTLGIIWVPFLALVLQAGELSLRFGPHILWGNPWMLKYPSGTSASNSGSHQPSHTSPTFPTSLIVVEWFLLSVLGYKASL